MFLNVRTLHFGISRTVRKTYGTFWICTRVVPKLVLILSGRICNPICWNFFKTYVFYSALLFQQVAVDARVSNTSQVTAGFVKTVACTPPGKRKKRMKTQIYSLTSSSLSEALQLTFPFSNYHPIAAKRASILLTHFFNRSFKLLLQNVSKDCLDFLDNLGIYFGVPAAQFTFQRWKQLEFGNHLSTY